MLSHPSMEDIDSIANKRSKTQCGCGLHFQDQWVIQPCTINSHCEELEKEIEHD
ncbi:hypothetical protein MUK42_12156 [Musa troglodytarum]|nr:hypothetical protein MUK42_12156 [Musa troglodytarum]